MRFFQSTWEWSSFLESLLYIFLSALILRISPNPTHCAACIAAAILVRVLFSRRYVFQALIAGLKQRHWPYKAKTDIGEHGKNCS